ncbi:Uncharacterized conserved protein YjiS, DUF1127 family [Tistlia consotensis]|uniref:Uncharacterized conserved protein YjiS, DUF1127 family n=1 Tax=Tistlia consotensis USBA 355 TaxID=560819 RepID=A0A1Y6B2I3_9PROT|nr:DUF1127 domain-containing protein [Tistlia consotensis]SME88195.1 Uncharacterized conserved protein YjiS, DUF1127 family [Tistlia consotensis USBA 355]SNR24626.1 Uncharacterized conserved protein YjiS, DUF1127 family [Tistlia consotensis]
MTTMELRRPQVAAPKRRARPSLIAGLVGTLFTWQERWAQRERLKGLDDHMLHDLGLSRVDAQAEADKPFWRA